jgi:hypothetical protein
LARYATYRVIYEAAFVVKYYFVPISVAARSRTSVCGRFYIKIAGWNPAGGIVVCIFWVLSVLGQRSLPRSDHPFRIALQSGVCLSVIVKLRLWGGPGTPMEMAPWKNNYSLALIFKCFLRCSYLRYSLFFPSPRLRKIELFQRIICVISTKRYDTILALSLVSMLTNKICKTFFTLWTRVKYLFSTFLARVFT